MTRRDRFIARAGVYVARMRNDRKRAYARAVMDYLIGSKDLGLELEDLGGVPVPAGLVYMGAQAVRMHFREDWADLVFMVESGR